MREIQTSGLRPTELWVWICAALPLFPLRFPCVTLDGDAAFDGRRRCVKAASVTSGFDTGFPAASPPKPAMATAAILEFKQIGFVFDK